MNSRAHSRRVVVVKAAVQHPRGSTLGVNATCLIVGEPAIGDEGLGIVQDNGQGRHVGELTIGDGRTVVVHQDEIVALRTIEPKPIETGVPADSTVKHVHRGIQEDGRIIRPIALGEVGFVPTEAAVKRQMGWEREDAGIVAFGHPKIGATGGDLNGLSQIGERIHPIQAVVGPHRQRIHPIYRPGGHREGYGGG